MSESIQTLIVQRLAIQVDRDAAARSMEAALLRLDFSTAASCRQQAERCFEQELDLSYKIAEQTRKEILK